MTRLLGRALAALGVDRRSFECLAGTFVLMDLRGQHFARATGARHRHRITPLFWVVGQCLTLSAVASLVLFARVDVFFFSFASLSLSLLVTATAVLVELHEVVLDPRDLEVIGHRPVSPRTYAAARLANLLFYVALMYLALNTFPLVLGAGLRDAGPWYLPAYAIASLAGTLIAVGLLILLLPLGDSPAGLEQLKEILAWVQIVLILVVGYGAQLIFRDGTQSFLVWAAFPPRWVDWTPPAWLARFVEAAATEPGPRAIGAAGILATLTVLVVAAALRRLARLYGRLEPARRGRAPRPMPAERVGGLAGPVAARLLRSPAERAGFWLAGRLLAREGELKVRCLLPLNLPVAAVALGLATGQFADPVRESDPRLVTFPILAVYLVVLAVPPVVYNLAFTRDHEASWVLRGAPLADPGGLGRGMAKALMAWIVAPACLGLFVACALAWRDPVSAALHAALAFVLSWPMALAALLVVLEGLPFSLPRARGGSLGPVAVPLAALSVALAPVTALHYAFARSPLFWAGAAAAGIAAACLLPRRADARLERLWRRPP